MTKTITARMEFFNPQLPILSDNAEHTSWAKLLKSAADDDGEDFDNLMVCTRDHASLNEVFYDGYGGVYGTPNFTAWGDKWVYFPLGNEGVPAIGRAPRNPCGFAMEPQA
jgi:hypothetical protein